MIGDILLPNDRKISIKGTFKGIANVRLLNKMGEGDRQWKTATLFVVSGLGVVFGAPDMVYKTHLKNVGDALVIRKAGLKWPDSTTRPARRLLVKSSLKRTQLPYRRRLRRIMSNKVFNFLTRPVLRDTMQVEMKSIKGTKL